jgi:type IV pilus assembly protein PilE
MKKNVRRGFTLPEILVTVTVIAVLAAVVVPAVTQYVTKGDAPASSSDIAQVRNAITGYIADTRHYPADFSDLVSNTASGISNWKGPYFAGALSGVSGVSATFISNGSNVTLGPSITQSGGFLTTNVSLASDATCQDLWNLDAAIDGGSSHDGTSGALQWNGTCASGTDLLSVGSVTTVTLQLTAIGS